MKRREGPVPEEYWGCSRACWDKGRHSRVFGQCERAEPVCEHPAESICIESDASGIVCGECREEMSVRKLAEAARVGLSRGCTCSGDICRNVCEDKPVAWSLDPAKVLRILYLEGR